MNIFEKMIDDCFSIPQFISTFETEDGKEITCITYETATDTLYTEFGYDEGVSFYITCKVADFTPKKGAKITYNGRTYKIDTFRADSFNLSYNIYLKDLTSK